MAQEPTENKIAETLAETFSDLPQNVKDLIPEGNMGYYKSTNEMHCDKSKPGGSKFSEISNIFEVLDKDGVRIADMVARREDDRQALLDAGTDPKAFLPATKGPGAPEGLPEALYYKVEGVKGKLGVIQLKELDPKTPVIIRREKSVKSAQGKEMNPCSFSVIRESMDDMPDCDFATVIIGRENGTGDELWTIHPGAPVRAKEGNFVAGSEKLQAPKEGEKQEVIIATVEDLLKSGEITEADYVKIMTGKQEEVLSNFEVK